MDHRKVSLVSDVDSNPQLRTADSLPAHFSALTVGVNKPEIRDSDKGTALCAVQPATLGPAGRSVFETVELLEGVLGYLPLLDIVVSTRVCRQFRNVIAASDTLRRALLKKVNANEETSERWRIGALWRRSPLGNTLFGCYEKAWFERLKDGYDDNAAPETDEGDSYTFLVAQLNPLLQETPVEPYRPPPPRYRGSWLSDLDCLKASRVWFWTPHKYRVRRKCRMLPDLLHGRLKSWQNMFLSNPPCNAVLLAIHITIGPVSCSRRITATVRIRKRVDVASGVTLGDIAKHLSTSTGVSGDSVTERDTCFNKRDDSRLVYDGYPKAFYLQGHYDEPVPLEGYPGEGQPLGRMMELMSSDQEPLELKNIFFSEISLLGMVFPTEKDVEDVHNGAFEVFGGLRYR